MTIKKYKPWFRPKPYPHFSPKISYSDLKWLASNLRNPMWVKQHAFFPFIHREVTTRTFRRDKNSIAKIRIPGKSKPRHIFYSTHLDTHIFAYYARQMSKLYEKNLCVDHNFSNCIIAYRQLPKYKSLKNKGNIEFAADVFDYIKASKNDRVALAYDITSFFDNLDHKKLKDKWCKLLNKYTLPDDHHNVYKSLIRYCFVDEIDVLNAFSIKHRNDLRKFTRKSFSTPIEFREKIVAKGLLKFNSASESGILSGIPQGTPISAFLSNLYLLDFDKTLYEFVVVKHKGLYKRYSDDILIIVDSHDPAIELEIDSLIKSEISKMKLAINEKKTQKSYFKLNSNGIGLSCDKPLTYLGFEFDGDKILIKPSGLAKYYRSVKRKIRICAWRASQRKPNKHRKIFRDKIYKFSFIKSRNFISYALRASEVLDDDRKLIRKQIRHHWKIIHDQLHLREKQYNL